MRTEIDDVTKALFALEGFFAESLELHTGAIRSAAELKAALKANELGIKEMMKSVEGVGSVCRGNGAYRITIAQALEKMKKAGNAKDALKVLEKGRKDAEKSAEAIMAFRVAFAKLEGKIPDVERRFKMLAHQKAAADRALKYWAKEKANMKA